MDPIFGVIVICWAIKVLAEDGYSTVTGKPNPRLDRRRVRQRSRAGNPIWTQLVGWLGDVAEDARTERARARAQKRARQDRDRRNNEAVEAEVIEDAEIIDDRGHPGYNQDPADPSVVDMATPPPVRTCPADGSRCGQACLDKDQPPCEPERKDLNQEPQPAGGGTNQNTGGFDMTEFQGLDGCIAYCDELLAAFTEHAPAGASGEQYVPYLEGSKVSGADLQSGHDMQAAIGSAVAAIEEHKGHLENQKVVQEAYDTNQGAGDKEYQQAGR